MTELIEFLDSTRYIENFLWNVASGNPVHYVKDKRLALPLVDSARTHSFIYTNEVINKNWEMGFELEFHENAIFNFVYNYKDDGTYTFLRLDRRDKKDHGKMVSLFVNQWQRSASYLTEPAIKDINQFQASYLSGNLTFKLNGTDLMLKDSEFGYDPETGIGIFNEIKPVVMRDIRFNIL